MIDTKKLERAKKVQKWAMGSSVTPGPFNDNTRQSYAKANGLIYRNGQFFEDTGNGQTGNEVNVDPNTLTQFAETQAKDKINGIAGAVGGLMDMGQQFLSATPNVQNQSVGTMKLNAGYDMATEVVGKFNPLAGTIMKAGGFASDALTAVGISTDQITGMDKFMDSKFMKLTPFGLINAIGASKTRSFSVDQNVMATLGHSYQGLQSKLQRAQDIAGKSVGTFSNKGKLNAQIDEAATMMDKATDIANTATDQREMVSAMGDIAGEAYSLQTSGGIDPRFMRVSLSKEGGQLNKHFVPEIIDLPEIEQKIVPSAAQGGPLFDKVINPGTGKIETWKPEIIEVFKPEIISAEDIDLLKSGGKIEEQLDAPEIEETDQKNLLPTGALHKNKHHMDNTEEMTQKGIPVVDNNQDQQAEIERDEIIFIKEVTVKMEELYKEFYAEDTTNAKKDELAIDCGKLICHQVMLNTDDKTGLIDSLEQGGVLSLEEKKFEFDILGPDQLGAVV